MDWKEARKAERSGGGGKEAAAEHARGGQAGRREAVLVRLIGQEGKAPVEWAASRLAAELERRSVGARVLAAKDAEWADLADSTVDARAMGETADAPVIEIAVATQPAAGTGAPFACVEAESFVLERTEAAGRPTIAVTAAAERGHVYGLLELADRVRCADDPLDALRRLPRCEGRPVNEVRGISRMFVSEEEDLPWFRDESFWDDYLTELAMHRFNRFNLAFGMGYDYGHDADIRDNYLYFAYPFLLDVPGHSVTVEGLAAGEADRNLAALRRIGEQVKQRGLDFHVGIWTNAYDVPDSPQPRYTVRGLHSGNHAAYCRDALALLLRQCPQIDGLTLRVHYESGIPEPAHAFWRSVLSGIASCGRDIRIDIHSKGVDADMIRMVRESSQMPLAVSPKYWAEHLGLPYHQASNREREMPEADFKGSRFAAVTSGSRKATRYGYADFLTESRDYDIFYRVWPGTQKLLLWGDPVMAAEYGRAASFGGSQGMELFEPLSFKGRKTSGTPGGRELYKDEELRLGLRDWTKYAYTYRLWGRLLYNPDADAENWRRYLRREYGDGAADAETALGAASRILPLVTVAHHPSSANVDYWPELYTNLAVVRTKPSHLDYDLPEPKTFGAASPLDPQLFETVAEHADHLARGTRSGKVTPAHSARTLEGWADEAERALARAERLVSEPASPPFRRLATDVRIQAGLGRFFAHKLRAGIRYELFARTGDSASLDAAIRSYEAARDAWAAAAAEGDRVYRSDLAFGHKPHMRGHWKDRLPGIEDDIAELRRIRDGLPARRDGVSGAAGAAASAAASAPASASAVGEAGESPAKATAAGDAYESSAPFAETRAEPAALAASAAPVGPAAPGVLADPAVPGALADGDAARSRPACRIVSPASYRRGEPAAVAVEFAAAPAELNVRLCYRRLNQAERYATVEMTRRGETFTAVIPAACTDSDYAVQYYMIAATGSDAWLVPGFGPDMTGQPYIVLRPAAR